MDKKNKLYLIFGIICLGVSFIFVMASTTFSSIISMYKAYPEEKTYVHIVYVDEIEQFSDGTIRFIASLDKSYYYDEYGNVNYFTENDCLQYEIDWLFNRYINYTELRNASDDKFTVIVAYEVDYSNSDDDAYYGVVGLSTSSNTFLSDQEIYEEWTQIMNIYNNSFYLLIIITIGHFLVGILLICLLLINKKKNDKYNANYEITFKNKYQDDPIMTSYLPYYKATCINDKNLLISLNEDLYSKVDNYFASTSVFFKAMYVKNEENFINKEFPRYVKNIYDLNSEEITMLINNCYLNRRYTPYDIDLLRELRVTDSNLWFGVKNDKGVLIALIIGSYDNEIKEASIELLGVLPQYRKAGLGTLLIKKFVSEVYNKANIITVYDYLNNQSNTNKLFEECGFTYKTNWYVTRKE